MPIYLDYAAATPVNKAVQTAMQPYWTDKFYNPSGLSMASRSVKQDLQRIRETVAHTLNTRHQNVIFTVGASEANNLVLHGMAARNPGCHMLISAIEHDAILNVMPWLEKWFNVSWDTIPVNENGEVKASAIPKLIQPHTVLASVMHINNETGVMQNLRTVKKQLEKNSAGKKIYLHSDMSQTPLVNKLHFDRIGADAITLNGGKIYGPKQSGALVGNFLEEIDPLVIGGGQERGLRAGTESLGQIKGFATAFVEAQVGAEQEQHRLSVLQEKFEAELKKLGGVIHCEGAERSPSITSVRFDSVDSEEMLFKLEEHGVIAASGSACSAADHSASHVLKAVGLSDAAAKSTLRFSYGKDTNKSDLDTVASILKKLLPQTT